MSLAVCRQENALFKPLTIFVNLSDMFYLNSYMFAPVWISHIELFKIKEVYTVINQKFIDM